MAIIDHYYSDGNLTTTGNLYTLAFRDDANGTFDPKSSSFQRVGNNLEIIASNGSVITITDHFLTQVSALWRIRFFGTNNNEYPNSLIDMTSAYVVSTANETITLTHGNSHDVLGGTGDNVIYAYDDANDMGSTRIYGGNGDDTFHLGQGVGDYMYGGSGDDTFFTHVNSLSGSVLHGGSGHNKYHVEAGSFDTIIHIDDDGYDEIFLGQGITFENMYLTSGIQSFAMETTDASVQQGDALSFFMESNTTNVDRIVFDNGDVYRIEAETPVTNQFYSFGLIASDDDNIIHAAGGSYNLHAGGGNDIIYGNDYEGIGGNPYPAYLYGDDGDDIIYNSESTSSFGGNGNDTLYGSLGIDHMHGGNGNDQIFSNSTGDHLYGDDGDDYLHFASDSNGEAHGGDGCDVMYISEALPVHVTGTPGFHLHGGAGDDVYVFNRDTTTGAISGISRINDTSGDYDTIALGEGFNLGNVELQTTSFLKVTDVHPVRDYHMVEVHPNFPGDVIERVVFADGTIYDTTTGSVLTATNGDDNPIYLTAWHDRFDALGGNDVVYALKGDDVLLGNAGNDHFDGGQGNDTVDYTNAAAGINANLAAQKVGIDGDGGNDTLSSIENITGSTFRDVIYGSAISNIIRGGSGNDYISSLGGGDFIYGEDGNDTIYGGADTDHIDGGNGDDLIITYAGDDDVFGGDGRDMIFAGANAQIDGGSNLKDEVRFHTTETVNSVTVNLSDGALFSEDINGTVVNTGSITGVEYVRGTQQGDTITGDSNDNLFVGYGGNDVMSGGDGQDYIDGGDGNDTIYGGDGDDMSIWVNGVKTVNAGLYGGDGDDILNGGSGSDWLYGGNGNDILESNGDKDHLYGNAGADTFVFKDIAYNDTTLIHDFDLAEGDAIDVSDLLTGFNGSTDDVNDYMTLAEAGGHTYVWADQNGTDAGGNILLARLTGVTGLDLDTMYLDGDIII